MSDPTILICQNTACRKAGSAKVLAAFQTQELADITIVGCRCLGQCGNGPMVLILPEQVWYHRVHPDEVATIVQHLRQKRWVETLLYPKFHQS
jgi:(2Fe-2S) ferredoxin